jgi:hypothetical protein
VKWTLHIPITLTTANARVVNGAHAATAAIYRRHRDACALALTVAARNAGVPTFDGTGHFRWVRLVRLYTGRQRAWDSDNLVAACKALRDAHQPGRMTSRGPKRRWVPGAALVLSDGPTWSAWGYDQRRDDRGGVEVVISDEPIEPVRAGEEQGQ